jgi:hypothetical protein
VSAACSPLQARSSCRMSRHNPVPGYSRRAGNSGDLPPQTAVPLKKSQSTSSDWQRIPVGMPNGNSCHPNRELTLRNRDFAAASFLAIPAENMRLSKMQSSLDSLCSATLRRF